MMTSLCSIFDPYSSIFLSNWTCFFLLNFLFIYFLNLKWSLIEVLLIKLLKKIPKELLFFLTIFMIIFLSNMIGLIPYTFSYTSQGNFNFSMALSFWLAGMIFYMNDINKLLYHLTPLGCPILLIPFMVMVETISNLIRPISLALRLTANITAGHMILTLMSLSFMITAFLPFTLSVQFFFILFETAIGLIQSFVFMFLLFLYWDESM